MGECATTAGWPGVGTPLRAHKWGDQGRWGDGILSCLLPSKVAEATRPHPGTRQTPNPTWARSGAPQGPELRVRLCDPSDLGRLCVQVGNAPTRGDVGWLKGGGGIVFLSGDAA